MYTYAESSFRTSFLSGFSQWRLVREDDALPYLPTHRAQIRLGLAAGAWDLVTALKFRSPMREEAGADAVESGLHAEALTTLDVTGTW